MTTRLVLDRDTGSDDAVTIMAAALHPGLELLAISTVNGNVALPNTENTLGRSTTSAYTCPSAPAPPVRWCGPTSPSPGTS
ncbi:nucleoside hydrolase [Saccharopolyspora spinosa]|uniref:nucleoside hydrolase n=1 Tax=Saccharopolyspora spinosa TaxID=60894 RepID=UPI0002DA8FF7|nr:nucleoside hydrolase [Saccharopolyspora spinosa]